MTRWNTMYRNEYSKKIRLHTPEKICRYETVLCAFHISFPQLKNKINIAWYWIILVFNAKWNEEVIKIFVSTCMQVLVRLNSTNVLFAICSIVDDNLIIILDLHQTSIIYGIYTLPSREGLHRLCQSIRLLNKTKN